MAQERIDDFMQMAKDYAKAENPREARNKDSQRTSGRRKDEVKNQTNSGGHKMIPEQLTLNMEYGISEEQACILCHLSSECAGCCIKCMAENKNGSCYGQTCSQQTRDHDGQRWDTWMYLISTSLPELKSFVPVKFRRHLK